MPKDLSTLPQLKDSLTFLYIEKAAINQDSLSIILNCQDGRVPVPIASLTVLMLGPRTSITHDAIKTATDNGCSIVWCGERGSYFYAAGRSETHSAENVLIQAKYCMDDSLHMQVVRRMYEIRFPKMSCKGMTLQQIRGLEGIRVREAYRAASRAFGVAWKRRDYKRDNWNEADPINKAISYGNMILYSLCEAAIVSLGYSPALGFVHTGKTRSFVYDIADFYKVDTTIPAAFEAVTTGESNIEATVRRILRRNLHKTNIMSRLPKDIAWIFDLSMSVEQRDSLSIGALWEEKDGRSAGGKNYSNSEY